MTKEKDALLLAEAYKQISASTAVNESLDLDPESWNVISHALAALGTTAAIMLKQKIDAKTATREAGFARSGSATNSKIDSKGSVVDDGEMTNTHVSPDLQRAQYEINKNKPRMS